jgi:hypothetical protein
MRHMLFQLVQAHAVKILLLLVALKD